MLDFDLRDVRWGPVALGWVIAVVAAVILGLIAGAVIGAGVEEAGTVTAGIFISSLIVGFISYAIGGFFAARRAGTAGTTNGVAVAVLGIVVFIVLGIILALFGVLFFDGQVPATPGFLGYAGGGFLTVVFSFIFNALGGYVGGRLSGGSGSTSKPSRVR